MQTMREAWTDERLDDLKEGMHREFDQVHTEIGGLRTEMKEQIGGLRTEMRDEIGGLRAEVNAGFNKLEDRFDSLIRTLIVGCFSVAAAIVAKGGF